MLLTPSGHARRVGRCPLIGARWTSSSHRRMFESDPKRTSESRPVSGMRRREVVTLGGADSGLGPHVDLFFLHELLALLKKAIRTLKTGRRSCQTLLLVPTDADGRKPGPLNRVGRRLCGRASARRWPTGTSLSLQSASLLEACFPPRISRRP